jgi:eukaryotic-like serine/threonine-protein kinase
VTPEHYRAVRALYEAVVDLPRGERAAHLRRLSSEPALIADVLALFDAGAAAAPGWITRPVSVGLVAFSQPSASVGEVIGAWKIAAEIGEGGMGRVYLVERCDGHFEQTAALKLLKDLPSAERLAYFSRERQLLAKLTHPNIARLYDGGTSSHGQPFLVMEYVDGLPVDQHCRDNRLNLQATLKLFFEACHGVAFAHRQLIVHCDIKPSNLLITKEGRPVLLDFGIARLSDPNALPEPSENNSAQAFTPRYASPEQRDGAAVSTLSDIYSLGRLLAELLEVAAGSDRELAAIIGKANHADPGQRYPSVDALIDDLHRYQQRLPLRAMPATRGYVTGKFLARRWPLVVGALAFAATVTAFTTQVIIERDVATAQRDRATQAEASAQRINAFLSSVLSSVDPDNALSMDRSLMQSVLNQAAAKAATELRDRPRELREISTVIADSYFAISYFAQALRHYQIAQGTFAGIDTESSSVVTQLQLLHKHANTLIELSELDAAASMLARGLAQAGKQLGALHEVTLSFYTLQVKQLFAAGQRPQALALAEENYRRMQPIRARNPALWYELLNLTAILNSDTNHFERAQALHHEAIALANQSFGATSSRSLRARNSLAVLLVQSKRYAAASELLEPLVQDAETYLGPNHLFTISALTNLGIALRFSGNHERSGEFYVKAHARSVQAFGATHTTTLELANNLALYELANGQTQQALQRIEGVVRLAEASHARLHPFLVEALRTHAHALGADRQLDAARSAWREVIARDIELYGEQDATTIEDHAALAKLPMH